MLLSIVTGYTTWNCLEPDKTCARCHEIMSSHNTWISSAHVEVRCVECHGTAMSNGFRSMKEKTEMVVSHFSRRNYHDEIQLNEQQVLDIADRCVRCHQAEYAGWLASGHAVNYREIFMNEEHNAMEKPYWDCFRCHGMFYNGTINDLMNLEGNSSLWHIKDTRQELKSTIPCLTCHQIHTENHVSIRYVSIMDSNAKPICNPHNAFFVRSEKMHLRSDMLTPVAMKYDDGRKVSNAIDPNTLLCQQCHAPDYLHIAGSQDDRTPIGVHEGISCTVCHKVHSGDTRESCVLCHSEVSKNCRMDVRTMHTTYLSKNSPNDIHRISCVSCHEEKKSK